ncbi:hypothetical protein [Hydrogenimonas thermophila]|uniref:Uncharacterized protein n=1 Tax=Hydrogenimonas thermophila TaxID=223786 RepID=A0A1I5TD68_9BACT|nr:hypothetical protein [Hydrogenimonas thermophila]SFP80982.1 hypothetical protein SAMN05216234_1433 [Hydrogenimonas thermophila]HIP13746.1 hypothetical protein [Arcobacter sp.]
MSKIISTLSKMWLKITNLENTLFPELKESLKIDEFTPKDREQIARAFIAKSVYNIQTTRELIDRLHIDRTLRILSRKYFFIML